MVEKTPFREHVGKEANKRGVDIQSITLRDSFLWSPAPDDIDVYVVVTGGERHNKAFKRLPVAIPQYGTFDGDVWFVGVDAINDLQRTWMCRRGVTIYGEGFTQLPTEKADLYLAFALSKAVFEAIGFRDQNNYHKMVHRIVAGGFYGIQLYADDITYREAHEYVARGLLSIMHTDANYGDCLRSEYSQAIEQLMALNVGVAEQCHAAMNLITTTRTLANLNPSERSTAASLTSEFFELFPDEAPVTVAKQIQTSLNG